MSVSYTHLQIKSFEEIDRPVFNKINLVHDSEFLDQHIPELKKVLGSDYQLLKSCPRVVELIPSGISTGSALKYYMDRHGISPEDVYKRQSVYCLASLPSELQVFQVDRLWPLWD